LESDDHITKRPEEIQGKGFGGSVIACLIILFGILLLSSPFWLIAFYFYFMGNMID